MEEYEDTRVALALRSGFGRTEQELGEANERRVLEAFQDRALFPDWLAGVRRATNGEDARGIDVVFATRDLGKLFIQVKSSERRARDFSKAHARGTRISVVIVTHRETPESIRRSVLVLLERERAWILRKRGQNGD